MWLNTHTLGPGVFASQRATRLGRYPSRARSSGALISSREAGKNLARIAAEASLTFFAHYATDHVGHRGNRAQAVAALERVDRFLEGLVPALEPQTLLVVASDHGNIEEQGREHTTNPAFTLLVGEEVAELRQGMTAITDVAGLILRYLG